MIDRQQSKIKNAPMPVRVTTDNKGTYVVIGRDQLPDVRRALDASGIPFQVDEKGAHLGADDAGEETQIAVVSIELGALAEAQAALDADGGGAEEGEFEQGPPLLPVVSYDLVGGEHVLTITKSVGNKGQYKSFDEAREAALTEVDECLKTYQKGVQVQDTKRDSLVGMKKRLGSCTEATCDILNDQTGVRGAGKYPAVDKQ